MDINEEVFLKATGHKPENDDLDRCNCKEAGKLGHDWCGWSRMVNRPNFHLPYAFVQAERRIFGAV